MTDRIRRTMLMGAATAGATAAMGSAAVQMSSDQSPKVLDGKPTPEPPAERSAGPIKPGRGSMLQGKVAVVTGAARGLGRAIAVEMGGERSRCRWPLLSGSCVAYQREATRRASSAFRLRPPVRHGHVAARVLAEQRHFMARKASLLLAKVYIGGPHGACQNLGRLLFTSVLDVGHYPRFRNVRLGLLARRRDVIETCPEAQYPNISLASRCWR